MKGSEAKGPLLSFHGALSGAIASSAPRPLPRETLLRAPTYPACHNRLGMTELMGFAKDRNVTVGECVAADIATVGSQ